MQPFTEQQIRDVLALGHSLPDDHPFAARLQSLAVAAAANCDTYEEATGRLVQAMCASRELNPEWWRSDAPSARIWTAPKAEDATEIIANEMFISCGEGESVTDAFDVTAPTGTPLEFKIVDAPEHGKATLEDGANFTFTADEAASGRDSFTYRAKSGDVESNTATVHVAITVKREQKNRASRGDIENVIAEGRKMTERAAEFLGRDAITALYRTGRLIDRAAC